MNGFTHNDDNVNDDYVVSRFESSTVMPKLLVVCFKNDEQVCKHWLPRHTMPSTFIETHGAELAAASRRAELDELMASLGMPEEYASALLGEPTDSFRHTVDWQVGPADMRRAMLSEPWHYEPLSVFQRNQGILDTRPVSTPASWRTNTERTSR